MSLKIDFVGPHGRSQHLPCIVESLPQYCWLEMATGITLKGRKLVKKDHFLQQPLYVSKAKQKVSPEIVRCTVLLYTPGTWYLVHYSTVGQGTFAAQY